MQLFVVDVFFLFQDFIDNNLSVNSLQKDYFEVLILNKNFVGWGLTADFTSRPLLHVRQASNTLFSSASSNLSQPVSFQFFFSFHAAYMFSSFNAACIFWFGLVVASM